MYEEGGLLPGQSPPPHVLKTAADAAVLYCSTRRRSMETAGVLWPERAAIHEPLLIEAPLPPPTWPGFIKLSPRAWGVIARLWWWVRQPARGEETRREAQVRAAEAADKLIVEAASGHDVLVTAHGFFNAMIGNALKRRGWRLVDDGGFGYWSMRRFEKR